MRERAGITRHAWLLVPGIFLSLLVFASSAACTESESLVQSSANPWSSLAPTSSRLSLLDLSKLDVSHELVFSYGLSSSGRDGMGGLWLTTFSYPVSGPLKLDLSIGTSLSRSAARGFQADNLFLENFSLQYRPSDSVLFQFMYRGIPSSQVYFPVRSTH